MIAHEPGIATMYVKDTRAQTIDISVIDENTKVDEFKDKLRWNDLYYQLNKGL